MYLIWITGYNNDGYYAGIDNGRIAISQSVWGAQEFPTKSAAENRAQNLYDNYDEVRACEVIPANR